MDREYGDDESAASEDDERRAARHCCQRRLTSLRRAAGLARSQRQALDCLQYPLVFVCRCRAGGSARVERAFRADDGDKPFMAHLLKLAREIPVRMQRPAVPAAQ